MSSCDSRPTPATCCAPCRDGEHADDGPGTVCRCCGTRSTPAHLLPSSCHVCGTAVPDREGATRPDCWHDLTNAEADAAAREHDRRVVLARTPEAAYVDQHRPY